jgi:hypothetical protein
MMTCLTPIPLQMIEELFGGEDDDILNDLMAEDDEDLDDPAGQQFD